MSTEKKTDVQKIFNDVASHLGSRDNTGLATAIGVNYNTLMKWKQRGRIGDIGPFVDACRGINVHWLRTGEGPMFREPGVRQAGADMAITVNATAKAATTPAQAMAKAATILESDKYGAGLLASIEALHQAVEDEAKMKQVQEELRALREELAEMKELLFGPKKTVCQLTGG